MGLDYTAPARLKWHADEEEPPDDWSDAVAFSTLREALAAVVDGVPQTGHPWILCVRRVFAPHEIEELWRQG